MEDHADYGWEEELDENVIRALDEAYCQDLQSCMKDVEPVANEPDYGFEKVRQEATVLQVEMSKFRAEERINGASPQTWEGYDPKHAAIKRNLQEVGKARRSLHLKSSFKKCVPCFRGKTTGRWKHDS